jgi:hypothetical protein
MEPILVLMAFGVLTAQSPPPTPFALLEQATGLACSLSDDRSLQSEFALRGAADQGARRATAADLGCSDSDRPCLTAAWRRVDDDNLARLRSVVAGRGWPALEGDAARGAWLIAQHADPAPGSPARAFRDSVLPMVLNEVEAGRLEPQDYARMVDRNALADGQTQPFGTNRPCRQGRFDRSSIDSIEAVDQRRRDLGMDILLSESLSLFDDLCERDARNASAR